MKIFKAFTEKLAEKYHTTRVKLKAFICWQNFLITKRKTKLEKACKKKAEEVCYELATKYETKIKSVSKSKRLIIIIFLFTLY